ncbi:MAG: WXG100 family type VII secretion target [Sciscionella sp.]
MSTGDMKVTFGALEGAAADIQAGANQIEGRLDGLNSELAPLRSDWTGSASAAYQQAKAKWDSGMADMKALLAQIGSQVSSSNSDYQATENQNTNRWG